MTDLPLIWTPWSYRSEKHRTKCNACFSSQP